MTNNKNEISVYHVERTDSSQECNTCIELCFNNYRVSLSIEEFKDFLEKIRIVVTTVGDKLDKPKIVTKYSKSKPYSPSWLKQEMERLIKEENYEQAEELKQLMQLVKSHKKQEA